MMHLSVKKCFISFLCLSLLTSPFSDSYSKAKTTNSITETNTELDDNANSFRYQNGELKDNSAAFFLKSTIAPSNAWKKVNGVFLNSNLDPIEGATKKGIDVSHHQKNIDWKQVKDSDIDYAIVRCGYGQDLISQDDKYWKANADACTKYDIPFGTYLYSYATTVEKAIGEANHVLRLIKGYDLQYPIYYDLEDASLQNLSKEMLGKIATAFCETIEAAGYEAAIYANTDWFTNRLTDSSFDNWDRWVAQYNSVCKYTGSYNMWQCTSSGKVSGINGNVDLNFVISNDPVAEVTNISLNKKTLTMLPEESQKLAASILPKNAFNKSVTWTSSNPSVATVKNGTITSLSSGTTTITATSKDGTKKKASCSVTVQEEISGGNPDNTDTDTSIITSKAVSSFSYQADSTNAIKLSWKKTPEADGYTIYRLNDKLVKTVSSSTTSYTVKKTYGTTGSTLKPGTTYTFQIAPYKTVNNKKVYGKKVTLKTTTKPNNTTLKSIVKNTSSKTILKWNKTSSATGYVIYYSTNKSSNYKALKTINKKTTLSYTTTALKKGKTYYIKIATYRKLNDKTIYGGYSNIKSIKL